jgi:predicted transcriptional regulator
MITSGFLLRQYRELYGIKQWIFAARMGFSSAVLCDIEKGRKPLTPEIAEQAERILNEEHRKRNVSCENVQFIEPAV